MAYVRSFDKGDWISTVGLALSVPVVGYGLALYGSLF
jgi:hypothetical protein